MIDPNYDPKAVIETWQAFACLVGIILIAVGTIEKI